MDQFSGSTGLTMEVAVLLGSFGFAWQTLAEPSGIDRTELGIEFRLLDPEPIFLNCSPASLII